MTNKNKTTEIMNSQNPNKRLLIYNLNFNLDPDSNNIFSNNLRSGQIDVSGFTLNKSLDANARNIDSLMNDFQTAVMDLNTYDMLKKISNPPFPGKRNFVITTDEDLLNSSVELLEFAGLKDVIEYLEKDAGEETVLIAVSRELQPVFLNGNAAKELAIAFDPLIEGSETFIGGNGTLNLEYDGYFRYHSGLIRLNYKVVK